MSKEESKADQKVQNPLLTKLQGDLKTSCDAIDKMREPTEQIDAMNTALKEAMKADLCASD